MQGAQGPALMTLMGIEGLARPCVHCGSLSSSGSIFPVGLWLERADFTSVSGCKLAGLRLLCLSPEMKVTVNQWKVFLSGKAEAGVGILQK